MSVLTDTDLKATITARPERIPCHVAVIMDGNGRWAAQRGQARTAGHEAGVEAVRGVVRGCAEIGVKHLTLYTFSVENWKRPADEVSALMSLLVRTTRNEIDELHRNDVKLNVIGRLTGLPRVERLAINEAIRQTRNNSGLMVHLALNYGGRNEILDAVRGIAEAVRAGRLDPRDIDESLFGKWLYTADVPDPDLLIRTSGEKRLSNFLLWQSSYTELYITDIYWPDFSQRDLFAAIADYQQRERRFGRISS